jgi:Kef-type K+ transport system membrane component KefB
VTNNNNIFIGILGIVLLGSGIAYYLGLSPLFVCFIAGIILGNLSKFKENILKSIEGFIHPLSILLVIYSAVIWLSPTDAISWVIILIFPILKLISKFISHKICATAAHDKEFVHKKQGIVFLSSDILVFALLLNYTADFQNIFTYIITSAIFFNIIIYTFSSSYLTKRFLVETAEIRGDVK